MHNFSIHFLFLLHQENSFWFVCFDLCLCVCVFLWHIIPHVCFSQIRLFSSPGREWVCEMDGEREREGGKCLCNQTPPSLSLSLCQTSSSLSPDPSISISSTPQLLYTSIYHHSFFLAWCTLAIFLSLTSTLSPHLHHLRNMGRTDILGNLSIPWLFDQPDILLRSLKYLSKTDLFIIKIANLAF